MLGWLVLSEGVYHYMAVLSKDEKPGLLGSGVTPVRDMGIHEAMRLHIGGM